MKSWNCDTLVKYILRGMMEIMNLIFVIEFPMKKIKDKL